MIFFGFFWSFGVVSFAAGAAYVGSFCPFAPLTHTSMVPRVLSSSLVRAS